MASLPIPGFRPKATTHRSIKREIGASIDGIYLRQLGPISLVIFTYYVLLASSHYFLLAGPFRIPMMVMALATAIIGLMTALLVRRGHISPARSHVALLPAALASTANVFVHVFLSGEQLQLTNALLMIMAFGIITLSPVIFGLLVTLGGSLFIAALLMVPGQYTVHLIFLFGGGLVLSILAFIQRYRTLWNAERLSVSNREKALILGQMNEAVKRQMHEAREAAEQARKANEAKDIFLANTSHELRTPLTGVLGMLDILAQSRLGAEERETLDAAQFSARTLLAVINDILDLAKLDAGKIEINPQPFRPHELVRTVVDLLAPRAEAKGVKLVLELEGAKDLRLQGDAVRIGQILFNFLSNAVKFTDEGTVTVHMAVSVEGDGYRLFLRVRDTGIGFDMAQKDQLFARFHQLESGSDRKHEGTGLGLAICKELADLMDGEIGVDSTPGQGSEFSVSLPLAQASGRAGGEPSDAVSAEERLKGRTLRVLVAEDNAVNRLLISKLLARFDWALTLVEDGAQALAAVEAEDAFDLILMDVRMPVMDGVAATRAIRALDGPGGRVPIIALTANTMPEDAKAYLEAGMDAVVGKPVQMPELLTAVADLVVPADS
ncbi:ATP-binding protein [Kordiimonas marina]|uniref:ATP-binding protein n=1 Tax=Kordiimonas marina TaxID=2872312 RepID=UPI001FF6902C|nr:ATP-binding protein [Kordiimonas marina]MCJ9430718.1 response regulator [Kordiimonas marina]